METYTGLKMKYLINDGEPILTRDTTKLRELIGTKVMYLLKQHIDTTGRGYYYPRTATIKDVYRRKISFNGDDYECISDIVEMVKLQEPQNDNA